MAFVGMHNVALSLAVGCSARELRARLSGRVGFDDRFKADYAAKVSPNAEGDPRPAAAVKALM